MLTRNNKIGLALAFLLGLSDIAILGALSDDDGPPIPIVVISVAIGVLTVALVARAWRRPTRAALIAIVALRAISGLGDALSFDEEAVIVTVSMIFLALTVLAIVLLRDRLGRPARHPLPA
jgi:drug/metabolite transporter (DMT)-like permease